MDKLLYSKYSNDRKEQFSIVTSIYLESASGKKWIEKRPRTKAAQEHVEKMQESYMKLSSAIKNKKIKINKCKLQNHRARFKYVEGVLLSDELNALVQCDNYVGVLEKIKWYIEMIKTMFEEQPFSITEEFIKVFGQVRLPAQLTSLSVSNIDLAFDNIIINEKINIIDYEWVFDFPVPVHFIIYRTLNAYVTKESLEDKISIKEVWKTLGLNVAELEQYQLMEKNFQIYVNKVLPLSKREKSISLNEILFYKTKLNEEKKAQIFSDKGEGFTEISSYYMPLEVIGENTYRIKIAVQDLKRLRIDPSENCCLLEVESALYRNKQESKMAVYQNNGSVIDDKILYMHQDAQVIFENLDEIKTTGIKVNEIEVIFKMVELPLDILAFIQRIYISHHELSIRNRQMLAYQTDLKNDIMEYQKIKQELTNYNQSLLKRIESKESECEYLSLQQRENQEYLIESRSTCESLIRQLDEVRNENIMLKNQHEVLKQEIGKKEKECTELETSNHVLQSELEQIKTSFVWKLMKRLIRKER